MKYKVPFVDFPLRYHRMESEIDTTIKEVISGGDFIMRQHLENFESNITPFLTGTKKHHRQHSFSQLLIHSL